MNRAQAIVASTVFAGASAWQAPVNSRLADSVGAAPASVVSFATGAVLLVAVVTARHGFQAVTSLPAALRAVRRCYLCGGLFGALYVVTAILTVGALGTGGVIATSVAGTLVGSVAIDWMGVLGLTRVVPGPGRWVGAALLIAGAAIIGGGSPSFEPAALPAVFVAGFLVALQPPVNARLAESVGGGRAALTQTLVALAAVAGFALLTSAVGARPGTGDGGSIPWWCLLGGSFGAAYVVSTMLSVPAIGAGGVAAASIAGGLAFGAAADQFGMFGLPVIEVDVWRAVALGALALGAALVLRRRTQPATP